MLVTVSFEISVFSDTSNMLSLSIFEHFGALNFAASNILSFYVFLCYKFLLLPPLIVLIGIDNESKKSIPTPRFFVKNLPKPTEH